MKYLIVGIGNYGIEYARTRHNIGFEIVDHLADLRHASFHSARLGEVADFRFKGRTFNLLKPTTYVNRSGRAVQYWMEKLKISPERLLVVVDDLNLPLGMIRIRPGGSAGGHNGLHDINDRLGMQSYARLRFGIGSEFSRGKQVDFVLGDWDENEITLLRERIPVATDAILSFGTGGLQEAMNTYNSKV